MAAAGMPSSNAGSAGNNAAAGGAGSDVPAPCATGGAAGGFEQQCSACASDGCERCLCSECTDQLEACSETDGCPEIAACIRQHGCQGIDCYCGNFDAVSCANGQADGPCKLVILAAPGGRVPTLLAPSAGPASDAAVEISACARAESVCSEECALQ